MANDPTRRDGLDRGRAVADKVRWGVLGAARIALRKVIPAMKSSPHCAVTAIASRDPSRARASADGLGIPKAYGAYEDLLADPEVDAVYVPLPNHLHVPWSIRAIHAGKHVLCEKPIALTAAEAQTLLEEASRRPSLKVMEAFMYRFHPQWRLARRLVAEGQIGELRAVQTFFSYWNVDPENVRNRADIGGGGMLDIGCYCVSVPRFLFGAEPVRVRGSIELDPVFSVDRLAAGVLEFPHGSATFLCSTQLSPYQRVIAAGTEGRLEIEIPFNAPPDRPCRIWHERADENRPIDLEVADQYAIQVDLFARAILDGLPTPTPLEDALANMRVIDAVFASARAGEGPAP